MSSNNNNGDQTCTCLPYKDPFLMTGQVMSLLAIFFSWGVWFTGLIGFIGFVMLQVAWCCRMNKCLLISAGVFACIASVGCLALGIYIFVNWSEEDEGFYTVDQGDSKTILYIDQQDANIWGSVTLVGAFLWLASGVCTFVFACTRMDRLAQQEARKDATTTDYDAAAPPVVVVPEPEQPVKDGDAQNV